MSRDNTQYSGLEYFSVMGLVRNNDVIVEDLIHWSDVCSWLKEYQ